MDQRGCCQSKRELRDGKQSESDLSQDKQWKVDQSAVVKLGMVPANPFFSERVLKRVASFHGHAYYTMRAVSCRQNRVDAVGCSRWLMQTIRAIACCVF
jgi:hypothetical protein